MKKIILAIAGVVVGFVVGYAVNNRSTVAFDDLQRRYDEYQERFQKMSVEERNDAWKYTQLYDEKEKLLSINKSLLKVAQGQLLTFKNGTIGLEFQYPAAWGEIEFAIRDGENEVGKEFRGNNAYLWFGGDTPDFTAGREGGFLDFGIQITDGDIAQDWKEWKLQALKTLTVNGSDIMIIRGSGEDIPGNVVSEGEIGALVRLSGELFPGAAFLVNESEVSLDEFETFLKTIKVY
jgi:phage protein U